ncbi:unnamed protein product (macronuclear) [Paramecium tetraurelia]|uniref:J domain-containing protein n=1 Tax=Paramecium tetraurelia TaxID=5888 RepID=A0CFP7_PARTE|nr:uncharacterized protein GSPATT00038055001 [Paramecium tetraurelia]CAK69614.1 unnamed protein product [Paramecium tetraurelia]|eukprot:XP_001437011.1 hypothetical protein (macronuclear) [Paramecium tetraurelia strain d4-2]
MLQKALKAFSRVSAKIDYTKDYYKILKLPPQADQSQIRIHYYQLAKKYHPDSQTPNSEKYQNVQEAFRILSDLEYRQKYDQKRVVNSDTARQTDQKEKNDNNTHVGYFDQMSQQQFEKKDDDIWKLKITVKQGQIQHNYYFSETELKEKSINCSEFEKVTSDLITNLKLNQASIEEYKNSSFSSTSVLKKVAEIAFLIMAIFVSKKK